jgi:hypothetical protein
MAETRKIEQPSCTVADSPHHHPAAEGPTMTPLDPNDARQGVTGQGARYVLFWSMIAIVIALIIVYLVFFT